MLKDGVVGWMKDAQLAYLQYNMNHAMLQSWGLKKKPKRFETLFSNFPALKEKKLSIGERLLKMRNRDRS